MLDKLNTLESRIIPTSEVVIAGIDEAGRGPLIGPLVYGLYVASVNESSSYKDSKLLNPEARKKFFLKMNNYAFYKIDPVYITTNMECGTKNLNQISREAVISLLKELERKCPNVKKVYIDGLGNNEEYKRALSKIFSFDIIIENKADSKYQVVSGASIVAKVVRDEVVEKYDAGSGYPADPKTVKWLKDNYNQFSGFSKIVRHSWMTVKRMLPENKSRKLLNNLSGFYTNFK